MTTYKLPTVTSYAEVRAFLGDRKVANLGNNTTIELGERNAPGSTEPNLTVRLHGNPIIVFGQHGKLLNNCGYATPTTHDRFAKLAGVRVFNQQHTPHYVAADGTTKAFPCCEWIQFPYPA